MNTATLDFISIDNLIVPDTYLYIIEGEQGSGKTSAANNIHQQILANNPEFKVVYFSFPLLLQEFVECIKRNKSDLFKNHFDQYDLIILDDSQVMKGKPKTDEAFEKLIQSFLDRKKYVCITVDKSLNSELPFFKQLRLDNSFERILV